MLASVLLATFGFVGTFAQNSPPPLPSSTVGPSPLPSPPPPALIFTDSTRFPITGNYTMGYVNNTVEDRCHRAVHKFQAQASGTVDKLKMGVLSQAAAETCGISFVLSTFPGAVTVGSSLLTSFTDLVAATPGTDEIVVFNATASGWAVAAGANYTITILPFTWATGGAAGTSGAASHCVFQMPYGKPGLPYAAIGQNGPIGQPCGATPWTTDLAGDGWALQIVLNGRPASVVVPSVSPSKTPTPTSTVTPTSSKTGTPTSSPTPTGTPTITDTPTPTLSAGATSSNSPTGTRTPSRTPSISYSPTPTESVTASPTPSSTPTPTPSLRIGASPSITPTETPGPTDSPSSSSKPLAGIAAGPVVAPPPASSTGTIIGAAIGGALFVVAVVGLAIRLRIVHAEINSNKVKSWRTTKKPGLDIEINTNPLNAVPAPTPDFTMRVHRVIGKRKSSFGEVAATV